MRRIALTATVLWTATAGLGCQTMGPASLPSSARTAASGYSYSAGRAVQTLAPPPKTVEAAALAAMDDLRIHSIRRTSEEGSVVLDGKTADNRRASVTIHPQNTGTRLSARVGLFGDERLSRALVDRVGIRLGALPPSAVPVEPPSEAAENPYFSRAAVSDTEMFKDQADAPFRGAAFP